MSVSVVVLIALVLVTAGLAAYRKFVTNEEDDYIHLGPQTTEFGAISQQIHTAETLDRIDKAGKALTAITAVYAVAVFAWFLYREIAMRTAL